jgi:DNA-binding NarL/FixJ family response regulator
MRLSSPWKAGKPSSVYCRQAEGRPFDLVILDLTVPGGMGGKETIKKLLEVDPGVRAIVSSGYSKDMTLAEYRKFGFSGVIAKPYRVSEFSKAVKDALQGPQ